MKGNFNRQWKRIAAGILTAAVCACSLPVTGMREVKAATPAGRDDTSIVYFVDCGDHIPETVCEGEQLGTHNSVTDQAYQEDAATGYRWGIVDTLSEPLRNGTAGCGGVFTDNTWPFEQSYGNADAPTSKDTNRYTKNQTENGIEVRYIDYEFEIEAGTYRVETYCTDPWGCSKSPTLLLNAEDPTAEFKAGKGKKIEANTPVREMATMETEGTLKVSFRAEGGENLAINVCYIKIVNTAEENPENIIARDMNQVVFSETNLTENLTLPTEGKYGSKITWKSSDEAHCSSTGVVTRPSSGETDAPVTLTATFSYNGVEKTQEYQFLVLAENPEEVLANDMAQVVFPDRDISQNLDLPTKGKNGSTITWKSSDEAHCSSEGVVTRPAAGEADAPVVLTATFSYKGMEKTQEYGFTVLAETDLQDLQTFLLNEVQVTDGYYLSAQKSDIAFLNKFDADRLLFWFRKTAKLDTKGKSSYQGWENSLIAGHGVGHYMTAAAQAVKVTGDASLKQKLDYMVTELKACQDALGTGFIFGAEVRDPENVERQFDVVEGKIDGSKKELNENGLNKNDTWVPWYTMHKIVQGLIDIYRYTDNEQALAIADKLGTWIYNRVSKWNQDAQNRILWSEYGGMNDCLYELYKYTKDPNHMAAAHKFDDPGLYQEILTKEDSLKGRHANTTIPKFVGALNRYVTLTESGQALSQEDQAYLGYVEGFWDLVVQKNAFITGGTSVMEHFRGDNALDATRTQTNCESCCAHNMLRISRELFRLTGKKKYADYYESTLRNAIMGSVDATNGSTMYFVPMATGYFKVFSDADPANNMFWCCTGTGMENFTKLGDSIYFHTDNALVVNQYVSSEVSWTEKKMKLIQDSDVTSRENAKFTVRILEGDSLSMDLYFRIPDWISGDFKVKVNQADYEVKASNGYAAIKRAWSDGDVVELTLPMQVKAYGLPDNPTVFGFKYGPTVLAAKLGTDEMNEYIWAGANLTAPGYKVVGSEKAYISIGYGEVSRQVLGTETLVVEDRVSVKDFITNIHQYMVKDEAANGLSFRLAGTDADTTFANGLTFVPFNTLNTERYGIYWYFQDQISSGYEDTILKEKEEGRFTNSLLDSVQPGYQQYENDSTHQMQESSSVFGTIENGGSTRYAKPDGYFSYNMQVNMQKKNSLLCQFAKVDNGKTIKISVGSHIIAQETLDYSGISPFYKVYYEIPAEVLQAEKFSLDLGNGQTADAVRVKFESNNGSDSARLVGGLYMTANYNNDASITSLTSNYGQVKETEAGYLIEVPEGTEKINLTVSIADKSGLLYIDGTLVNDTKPQSIPFDGTDKNITLKVYAEDHTTNKSYTVTIKKAAPAPNQDQKAAEDAIEKINAIGTVELTEDSKAKITTARNAYDALTDAQKALVPAETVKVLADAEAEYKRLEDASHLPPLPERINIQNAEVAKIAAQAYTGKALKPSVTVTYNGKKLVKDKDYTVSYSNNRNIGTAKAVITGKGDYIGTVSKTFAVTVKKNKTYIVGNYKYKIASPKTNGTGTVSLIGIKDSAAKKKLAKASIASTVKIGGKSFRITSIGSSAFKGCTKLTSVSIGKYVTSIGSRAFQGCSKLTSVSVGAKVKTIGSYAFYQCKKLKKIAIKGTALKTVGKNALKGIYGKATVKVPAKKLKAYRKLLQKKGQQKTVKITS